VASAWRCPFHGKRARKVSQKTGAAFIGCPDCHSFARPNPLAKWLGWRIGRPRPDPPNLFPAGWPGRPVDRLPF
jgi:hypothetical protein